MKKPKEVGITFEDYQAACGSHIGDECISNEKPNNDECREKKCVPWIALNKAPRKRKRLEAKAARQRTAKKNVA